MLFPNWPAPPNIKAVTLCRPEGVNTDNLSSFKQTPLPHQFAWLNQIHSNIAIEVTNSNINNKFSADASYTTESNLGCVVKTADCLPILLASKDGKWISAVHAGWRGLVSGVIESAFSGYSGNANNLMAWLGPAISQKHFEVGQEVYDAFVQINRDDQLAFKVSQLDQNKYYADLFLLAERRLQRLGVRDIYNSQQCTYSNPELYYSYRRESGTPERLITIIWMNN